MNNISKKEFYPSFIFLSFLVVILLSQDVCSVHVRGHRAQQTDSYAHTRDDDDEERDQVDDDEEEDEVAASKLTHITVDPDVDFIKAVVTDLPRDGAIVAGDGEGVAAAEDVR